MMAINAQTIEIIGTVLSDAETLLAGKPVSVPIASETVQVGKVQITTPATTIEITYTP
jgi:hypothetical protein